MKEKFIYETPAVKFMDFNMDVVMLVTSGSGNESPTDGGSTDGWYY